MSHEIEVKLQLPVAALTAAGLRIEVMTARHFEDNWLLDLDNQPLSRKSAILRVRAANGTGLLTYKEKAGPDAPASQFKLRLEIETEISAVEPTLEILARLGYQSWFRYQKYRTVYKAILPRGGELHVMADETPLGDFLELEGSEEAIAEAVECLGVAPESFILESYLALQLQHCQAAGRPLADMVFSVL